MKVKNALLLFLAALIWGTAFVAQSVGVDYVGPFTFNGIRSLVGGLFLLIVILIKEAVSPAGTENKKNKASQAERSKTLFAGGLCCGLMLTAASTLQQVGIMYTSVGKAGFITALYIIGVPILGLFLKKKVGIQVWISVCIAAVGLYLLCMKESLVLQKGDFLVFLCAIAFSVHILVIDYFSPKVDCVKMSCIQLFVCGVICTVLMFIFEQPDIADIIRAAFPILYAGILSSGVAYTLQIVGQKGMNSTVSSLILSLESVISALAGFIILQQRLTLREIGGCVLMFIAIILAQLPVTVLRFRRITKK